jgi:glycosyltransferase involved in cell wall biosynthesis
MSDSILISICIPAYKNVNFLKRLLDNIAIQSFKDFEVVITDDSPGNEIEQFCLHYQSAFPLKYFKNNEPLGSPGNWNAAIRKARGEWIKLMHDDDWFATEESLQYFANAITINKEFGFIFSGFIEVDTAKKTRKYFVISKFYLNQLKKSSLTLFKKNFIGHPSTTLVKNNGNYYYDNSFKWVVDIEFYIRYLNVHKNFIAIRQPLINIGLHNEQITRQVFRKPDIEIPELLGLYYKLPKGSLKNIFCYDYYWRFIRNMSIRSEEDVRRYTPQIEIPVPLKHIISAQGKFSPTTLNNGVFSKILMIRSYILQYKKL